MKAALIVLLMLLPEMAFSQNKVTKVVRVRYANAHAIADLVAPGLPISISADDALHAIVLKGASDTVGSAEQLIHELDTPSAVPVSKNKDIELIVSVIGASSGADVAPSSEMPETMTPVVKQLRAIFPYKNYQMLSSMLLRSREGSKADSKGIMKSFGSAQYPTNYQLVYNDGSITSENGKPVIHLRNFQFYASIPVPIGSADTKNTQFQRSDVSVATDVDLHEGQKTVVGKADIGSSDSALFVVLTARLVD
jgi:hypothetical protein